MLLSLVLFLFSLALVVKSADFAIRYSSRLASWLRLGSHIVGFLIIAGISILPETFISVVSAIQGIPSFGLGTLWGSNVADLTLVFAIVALCSPHDIKVRSSVLNTKWLYLATLSIPLLLGLDGSFSRGEGVVLIMVGSFFYYWILRKIRKEISTTDTEFSFWNVLFFLASMGFLLLGAYLTVKYGVNLAEMLKINPILIGMFVVGLGTTLPELFFSIKAVQKNHDGLALGDILGTVMSDATIAVGVVALIHPFSFEQHLVRLTGLFMLIAATFLFYLMKTEKTLTKRHAIFLIVFYIGYVFLEYLVNAK